MLIYVTRPHKIKWRFIMGKDNNFGIIFAIVENFGSFFDLKIY